MGRAVSDIGIRSATADDAALLLQLIGELADSERAPTPSSPPHPRKLSARSTRRAPWRRKSGRQGVEGIAR
jgi:hypothetical protein